MEKPRVGVSIILIKDNKVLLGRRRNAHGAGSLAFPGGHLEKFETFEDCAYREVEEEIGLKRDIDFYLFDYKPNAITNDFFKEENKHYITLFMRGGLYHNAKPKLMEPDKCGGWEWYDWKKLPNNLFIPVKNLLNQGYDPFKGNVL